MQGQRQTRPTEQMRNKLEEFKSFYGGSATLFSLESSMTIIDAMELLEHFETFLEESSDRLKLENEQSKFLNVITEIIHYFNLALQFLPGLAVKSGDLTEFVRNALDIGISGGGGTWSSYSIQFGLPAGISLALHFNTET